MSHRRNMCAYVEIANPLVYHVRSRAWVCELQADLDCSVPCVFIGAQADSIGMAYERSDAVATKIVDSCTEMRIPSAIPISDKVRAHKMSFG